LQVGCNTFNDDFWQVIVLTQDFVEKSMLILPVFL